MIDGMNDSPEPDRYEDGVTFEEPAGTMSAVALLEPEPIASPDAAPRLAAGGDSAPRRLGWAACLGEDPGPSRIRLGWAACLGES